MAAGKRPVLLLICGTFLAAGQAVAQQPKLTLAEAVERANRVQPSVVQAFGTVRSAEARQRSATGAFLPNLSLNASRGLSFSEGQQLDPSTGQFITSGNSTGSLGTSISSNVDLFTGFRRTNEKKAANANRSAAEASLVNARSTLQLTTTNQFFDVLAADQLLRVREASVRRAEEQLKVSVAILHAGRGIRSDSLRSVVTLGNAQLQLVNAQTALATAEANLGRLVGEDGPVGAVDDSSLYAMLPAVDTAALRAEAMAQAPAVKAAQASAASARTAIGVARAAYFPTLNLSGSMALNGSSRNSYTFLQSRQFSLGMSWPIFNRFQREQSIVNSEVSAETAEATAAEARRQVLASFTADLAALEAARLRIGITQTSVLAATEDLRVQQERYRFGAATIVEVLTSQEALSQAEVDAVTARFDYVRARAQISALIGRPL
ncbi:MAG TPA: TolC family protein [Gemmatimonadales bacterium]|jgi:outer membrane protein TolC|nr:TolC family protein [Gemmatimonadales bacterium]